MSSRLFQRERRDQIVALVHDAGRVSVSDLSERFGLSPATIRSDLDAVTQRGLLLRTHGGAIPADQNHLELSFDVRRQLQFAQKRRIGAVAAAMIEDGEAIALDASTTAYAIAVQVAGRRELTVITNGIFTALSLLNRPQITVLMPGGFIRGDSASLVGVDGRDVIGKYHFQKGFFGAKGITLQEGLTDVNRDEVALKRAPVVRTKQVIAVVDGTKWGRVGFASFAAIDEVACAITDDGAPQDMVAALRQRGVEVIVA